MDGSRSKISKWMMMKWNKLSIGTLFLGIMIYGCNPSCLFDGNTEHDIRIPFQIQPHQSTYSVGDTIDFILEMDQYYSETTEQFYEIENSVVTAFFFSVTDSLSPINQNQMAMERFEFILDSNAYKAGNDARAVRIDILSGDAQNRIRFLSHIVPSTPGKFAFHIRAPGRSRSNDRPRYDIDGDGCKDHYDYSIYFNRDKEDGTNRSLVEQDTSFIMSIGLDSYGSAEDILSLTNVYFFEVVE